MLVELLIVGFVLVTSTALLILLMEKRKSHHRMPGRTNNTPATRPRGSSWSKGKGESGEKKNWLVGRTGNLTHRTYYIGNRTVTIGRGVSNPIQVSNGKASRVHCRIETAGGALQIVDMNSANGTMVNGRLIKSCPLKHGDEVAVGDDVFVFHERGVFNQDDSLSAKAGGSKARDTTRMVRPDLVDGFDPDNPF
jgi:hypothetical protein